MINKFSEDYVSGFSHGYVRAETIGRKITKDACSQLGTAVLDNLLDDVARHGLVGEIANAATLANGL